MKKFFTLLCVAFLATSLLANVVTGTCGDNLQWAYDTDTKALTITGSGDMWDYQDIERPWEQVAYEITSVSLPDGLTSIGLYAFEDCSSLSSVTIPNSVTSLGGYAFRFCSSLTFVTLGNGLTSIGYGAFCGCSSLTSITIPNSVTSIKNGAFKGCSSLTSITIPNSVTMIWNNAFDGCSSLTSVTIGSGVTYLSPDLFLDCSSLSSIIWNAKNYPDFKGEYLFEDNLFIENDPFNGISSQITTFIIGDSVKHIPDGLGAGMDQLTHVTIGNNVTSIGENAFVYTYNLELVTLTAPTIEAYCRGHVMQLLYNTWLGEGIEKNIVINNQEITKLVIPNTVDSIHHYAFEDCSSLTSVTIPNSVTSIEEDAFDGCSSLTSVVWNAKHCADFTSAPFGNQTTSLVFGDGVEHIPAYLGYGMNKLTSVTIPNSVMSVGDKAFYNCSSLTSVTIGNNVTSIGNYAFDKCSSLTSVTIPNSVTSIGKDAFSGCSGLTQTYYTGNSSGWCNINFESNAANPTYYSRNLYINNQELKDLVIPNSISDYAFYNCSSLTSITIPNSVTSIGHDAFSGCNGLTKIIILPTHLNSFGSLNNSFKSSTVDSIVAPAFFFDISESSWATAPKHMKYVKVTTGELSEDAFGFINRSYKTLKVLNISATSNTTIADEAFKGSYNLDSLYLPSNLTYIPYMAVAECISLQSITIPATVEEIEKRAFENCRSLNSIIFEGAEPAQGPARQTASSSSSLWRIGSWAFYDCHQLQNLTIPEGVTEVGDAAFYGCTYLEDMVLPSTIQEIGDNSFALCAKLQKIYVEATTPPTIQAKTFFDVNRRIPVYVPDNAMEAYRDDPYWQEFNIVGKSNTPTIVENTLTNGDNGTHKLLRNGQLLILRDGKTYSVIGQKVE